MINISIAMQKELYDRIKKASTDDQRAMADWCRIAIKKELKRIEQQENK